MISYQNPTRNTVIGFTLTFLISMFLLIIAITDLFREPFVAIFDNKIILLMMIGATASLFKLIKNYKEKSVEKL
jgi:hypothetical protein